MRTMIDAAYPENVLSFGVPKIDALAGYIGGNTPNVWTMAEWQRLTDLSGARYWLPIFTRSLGGDPAKDSAFSVAWMDAQEMPKGATLALDLETRIDANYVRTFDAAIVRSGRRLMIYGSRSYVLRNPKPSGGYWVADYTGFPHLYPGSAATQWAGSARFGGAYDPNIVADTTQLWEVDDVTFTDADRSKLNSLATHNDIIVVLEGSNDRVGARDLLTAIRALPAPPNADAIASAVIAKLPAGSTDLTADDIKQAVKDALREGTGA